MLASLPMYDRPELTQAHRAYWGLIRDALHKLGIQGDSDLTPEGLGLDFWRSPDLCFSQTCGLPYRKWLHGDVQLVGTPDFGLEGCPPGYYRSALVARKDDPRRGLADFAGAVLAINGTNSHSGYAAFFNHIAQNPLPVKACVTSGAHRASARAVAEERADLASLDAVSWRLIQRWDSFADQLKVLEYTTPTPGLPYICGPRVDAAQVAQAVRGAIDALPHAQRDALGIVGLVSIPKADYLAVPVPAGST